MKQTLTLLLAVLMTMPVFARDFQYEYKGNALIYTVLDEEYKTCTVTSGKASDTGSEIIGELEIPEIAKDGEAEFQVVQIGKNAFWGCSQMTSAVIPNSVTVIANGGFGSCSGLTSVTLPIALLSIDKNTFYGCRRLTSIDIPESVTAIGESAFEYCTNLNSVVMGNGVTSIGWMAFKDCTYLDTLVLSTAIDHIESTAFAFCAFIRNIYYLAEDKLYEGSFFQTSIYPLATLYLSESGMSLYQDEEPWKNFTKVELYTPGTGIGETPFDENRPYELYNLNGVRITDPTAPLAPGIYLRKQATHTDKLLVK